LKISACGALFNFLVDGLEPHCYGSSMFQNSENDVDLDALKLVYERNPNARALLDYFSGRQRMKSDLPLDSIVEQLSNLDVSVEKSEALDILRELERCRCGKVKLGRRGWKTRMEFSHSPVVIGKMATGGLGSGAEEDEEYEAPSSEVFEEEEISISHV